MERLTKDSPQNNVETMMNYVFSKDGWAHIRHDGEQDDVTLTEWAKAQCIKRGCDEFPGETPEEIAETLCDCIMDGEGCPVALAYCFACQASHLRDRLKAIEDILGDEYDLERIRELAQAERDGRLVVLPLEAKEGDPLPQCFYGDGGLCPGLSAPNDDEPIEMCKRCWYCSVGYRQEDEEALMEAESGKEGDEGT